MYSLAMGELAVATCAELIADDDARFREVNRAATDLLGYPKPRLLQMRVWDITPDAQVPGALEQWRAFIAAGHQAGQYQVRTGDARLILVQFEATANVRPGLHRSLLRPVERGRDQNRPLDECPFPRPFPDGFDACPHFESSLAAPFKLHGVTGGEVRSCRHLEPGGAPDAGFYGRCELGDAIARFRLASSGND